MCWANSSKAWAFLDEVFEIATYLQFHNEKVTEEALREILGFKAVQI